MPEENDRKKRLARELRANLQRRKAQARTRNKPASPEKPGRDDAGKGARGGHEKE